jgi:Zn-dependent protease with chaperone function
MSEVALFIVIAMLYVTLARGRLLGSSVMIHEAQYPRVFAIVKRACTALEIPMPLVFVREDYFVPAIALGFGEPYSLVLSSHWIEQFQDDELAFTIGRQLGHIAAGHTRFTSLLSVNGNENALISLIFGAWLRRCELTCDKIGLLVCGSLDAAARAIAVGSFHHFGRQVNLEQFAEQGREIRSDSVLRWGEWLGAEPYATKRIAWMQRFRESHAYDIAEGWFLRDVATEPPALPEPGAAKVARSECAGWWRRFAAVAIDMVVVLNLLNALLAAAVHVNNEPATPTTIARQTKAAAGEAAAGETTKAVSPDGLDLGFVYIDSTGLHVPGDAKMNPLARFVVRMSERSSFVAVYLALLVAVAGQSFGMMIAGVRVVTTDFRKPGVWQTIWRYALVMALWPVIALLSPISRRIMLHDQLSGTRLITVERVTARSLASPA